MNFLPEDIVPRVAVDGEEKCRKLIGQINAFLSMLRAANFQERDLERMWSQHVSWYHNKTLAEHERAMLCALSVVISGGKGYLCLPRP